MYEAGIASDHSRRCKVSHDPRRLSSSIVSYHLPHLHRSTHKWLNPVEGAPPTPPPSIHTQRPLPSSSGSTPCLSHTLFFPLLISSYPTSPFLWTGLVATLRSPHRTSPSKPNICIKPSIFPQSYLIIKHSTCPSPNPTHFYTSTPTSMPPSARPRFPQTLKEVEIFSLS